ncbi:MAG: DUF1838 family protein [Henriciella sp.]|nr:DUF1838 family protein [Henriciella sp.]MBO6696797.1 DUF1838 family protein [Henriciella sp.]
MIRNIALAAVSVVALAACASTVGGTPAVQSESAEPDVLTAWVDARAGTGAPVHWVSEGRIYAYPSGEKLFGMIGFDSSTVIWPEDPSEKVIHLTRKTFAYTDAETGEVITEYNGQTVEPIAYPYQMIEYRYENGRIYGDVTQGTGDRVQKIISEDGIAARQIGDTWAFTAAVFLDFPLPTGAQCQAWENYDFFINPEGSVEEPHQMSWQRYGALPAWAGGEQAIYHLLSHRVESQDEFPVQLLDWARETKPQWLTPPADLAEIKAIQEGDAATGFSG